MFCSVVYEFLLMTQSKTCIFLIGQYNNLKTKSKNEFPSEHISVSAWEAAQTEWFYFRASWKKGQKRSP